jgi:hypothetical protein
LTASEQATWNTLLADVRTIDAKLERLANLERVHEDRPGSVVRATLIRERDPNHDGGF